MWQESWANKGKRDDLEFGPLRLYDWEDCSLRSWVVLKVPSLCSVPGCDRLAQQNRLEGLTLRSAAVTDEDREPHISHQKGHSTLDHTKFELPKRLQTVWVHLLRHLRSTFSPFPGTHVQPRMQKRVVPQDYGFADWLQFDASVVRGARSTSGLFGIKGFLGALLETKLRHWTTDLGPLVENRVRVRWVSQFSS